MVYELDASIPNDEAGSICPCSDKIEAVNMQWRLRGSPPEEVLHASSRVLPAELAPVSAAVALDVVEDSFSQLIRFSLEASVPAATEVEAGKYAVATWKQSARGGLTRLITRAAR